VIDRAQSASLDAPTWRDRAADQGRGGGKKERGALFVSWYREKSCGKRGIDELLDREPVDETPFLKREERGKKKRKSSFVSRRKGAAPVTPHGKEVPGQGERRGFRTCSGKGKSRAGEKGKKERKTSFGPPS